MILFIALLLALVIILAIASVLRGTWSNVIHELAA